MTGFELRKLIRRKSTLFGLLGLLVVSLLCTLLPVFQEYSYDAEGEVNGFAAMALEKRYARSFQGELEPSVFSQTVADYQEILNNSANQSGEGVRGGASGLSEKGFFKAYPYSPLLDYLRKCFSPVTGYDYDVVDSLTPGKAASFYEQRTAYIERYLEQSPDGGSYSEADKATFQRMNERIAVPMKFDYARGWELLLKNSGLFFISAFFILSICTAPVFSGEYQSGADAIILSTRHGRGKLIRAKIAASLLFASGFFLLSWFATLALSMSIYGVSGWDSPLQTLDTQFFFSPYPVTVLGAFLLLTLISWLACLAIVSFTLLLSSRMRTPFSVIIGSVVLLIAPSFIPESKENRLFNHLLALWQPTEFSNRFREYELFHGPGFGVPLPYAIGGAALLVTIVLLPFAYRGFRKHEVA